MAFDESKGTGSGYDLIYLDTNLNGVLEAAEKHAATEATGSAAFSVTLPPALFPTPAVPEGTTKALSARFLVYSLGNLTPSAMVTVNLRLTRGEQVWMYTLSSSGAVPAVTPEQAVALHAGPITIVPTVRPGEPCGIAARLQATDFSFTCSGPAGATNDVTILIQGQNGEVADLETVPLGRLGFG